MDHLTELDMSGLHKHLVEPLIRQNASCLQSLCIERNNLPTSDGIKYPMLKELICQSFDEASATACPVLQYLSALLIINGNILIPTLKSLELRADRWRMAGGYELIFRNASHVKELRIHNSALPHRMGIVYQCLNSLSCESMSREAAKSCPSLTHVTLTDQRSGDISGLPVQQLLSLELSLNWFFPAAQLDQMLQTISRMRNLTNLVMKTTRIRNNVQVPITGSVFDDIRHLTKAEVAGSASLKTDDLIINLVRNNADLKELRIGNFILSPAFSRRWLNFHSFPLFACLSAKA